MIPAEPVATVVARGEGDIGFQQVSELLPIKGTDFVGQLPPELQKITVFSAGTATAAREPTAGKAPITFLVSPDSALTLIKRGLEPVAAATRK
jgi:molybdate transport system substrate-binding protein